MWKICLLDLVNDDLYHFRSRVGVVAASGDRREFLAGCTKDGEAESPKSTRPLGALDIMIVFEQEQRKEGGGVT